MASRPRRRARPSARPTRGAQLLTERLAESSQEAIAEKLSQHKRVRVNQSSVSNWANAKYMPQLPNMRAMHAVLGIPIEAWDEPPLPESDADDDEGPRATGTTGR